MKFRSVFKNTFLISLGGMASKLSSFLLIPLYARSLDVSEFGRFELIVVTVSLLGTLLSLNISDGIMRLLLDKYKSNEDALAFGTGYMASIIGVCIIFASGLAITGYEIGAWTILLLAVQILLNFTLQVAKGCDKMHLIAISSSLSVLVQIGSIWFLYRFSQLSLIAILRMMVLSWLINALIVWVNIDDLKKAGSKFLKKGYKIMKTSIWRDLRKYSVPLLVSRIAWWGNNSGGRYVVGALEGVALTGGYSGLLRIASFLTTFQQFFISAWHIFRLRGDSELEDFRLMYKLYYKLLTTIACVLIAFAPQLAVYYLGEKYDEYQLYAPLVFQPVLIGAVYGFVEAEFLKNYRTSILSKISVVGALINLIGFASLLYIVNLKYALIWTTIVMLGMCFTLMINVGLTTISMSHRIEFLILHIVILLLSLFVALDVEFYSIEMLLFISLFNSLSFAKNLRQVL